MTEKEGVNLKDHVIICGLGATATHIIEVLESYGPQSNEETFATNSMGFCDYVVIENSEEAIQKIGMRWPHMKSLNGDATDDEILIRAGIRDAYGIFPVLSSEKDNLYITMAARHLNPKIRIVARTADMFNIGQKLFRGGANAVVSPNFLGGLRLISEIARPHATDFLDQLLHETGTQIQMVEVVVSSSSRLCGRTIGEADLPRRCGLYIIAMKKKGGPFYTYNPPSGVRIEHLDTLIAMGYGDQIASLRNEAEGD
jgi:voltage-gated potassium channel